MQLVSPAEICSNRKLNGYSWLFGLCLIIPIILVTCIVLQFVRGPSGFPRAMMVIWALAFIDLVLVPLWALKSWRIQLVTLGRRFRCALWASMGLLTLPYSVILGVSVSDLNRNRPSMSQAFITYLIIHVIILTAWIALSFIAWPIIRRNWPFQIQDGSSCPECGYCVRGVASRICPECGTAFDHTQLGLSPAEFERLVSGDV